MKRQKQDNWNKAADYVVRAVLEDREEWLLEPSSDEATNEFVRKVELAGMTWERWHRLPVLKRAWLLDLSNLSPQLTGNESYRVEVIRLNGERARFNVGRTGGWRPVHIEKANTRSVSGPQADRMYKSVRIIRRVQ